MCTHAREFLSQRGIEYESHLVEQAPVDRDTTLTIARHARRLLIKTGTDVVRVDARRRPLDDAGVERHLVHEDGFMRVPVLVIGDLLVRGYTDALYAEALGARTPGS
jgi:arsenate reductase-like glutaredoxin family protein